MVAPVQPNYRPVARSNRHRLARNSADEVVGERPVPVLMQHEGGIRRYDSRERSVAAVVGVGVEAALGVKTGEAEEVGPGGWIARVFVSAAHIERTMSLQVGVGGPVVEQPVFEIPM